MQFFNLIGLAVGVLAIIIGQYLEGGYLTALFNFPALLIVLGGTFGAVILETPFKVLIRSFVLLKFLFVPGFKNKKQTLDQIVNWGVISRRDGFLGLEHFTYSDEVPIFARKALQLLIDGAPASIIYQILNNEKAIKTKRDLKAAAVFESLGGYSPTIGIIGAVLGLIHVMGNLSDPDLLGPGIAIAFVATIYGVGFANLLYLPIANKLKSSVYEQENFNDLIIDGICAIANGENPRLIEIKLSAYLEA